MFAPDMVTAVLLTSALALRTGLVTSVNSLFASVYLTTLLALDTELALPPTHANVRMDILVTSVKL